MSWYSTERSGFPCRVDPSCRWTVHPDYSAVPGDFNLLGLRVTKTSREAARVAALQAAARVREAHEHDHS